MSPSSRPRLLLVAPHESYRIAAYMAAAEKLNVDLHIASKGKHSLVSEIATGLHVDLDNPRAAMVDILDAAALNPYHGVIASDDYTVELVAHIAQQLGLAHNPPHAARISRRKDLARAALSRHQVTVPRHRRIELKHDLKHQIKGFPYPCVVKPLSLSGSRGVIRVNNDDEFLAACQRIKAIISILNDEEEQNTLLVEEYIPGTEVAVEGYLLQGDFHPLAIFDKPDPLEGPYFEETYYITPSRLSAENKTLIYQRVAEACHAYGLQTGPVHAELRLWDNDAWIIEVASRTIGGECAKLLQFGTGFSLEELVIKQAMGEHIDFQPLKQSAGVLMIPTRKAGILQRVEGILSALKLPFIEDIHIAVREGHEIECLPEATGYLGFVFAAGPSPQQVEQALRQAHDHLNIVVRPLWKLQAIG